MTDQPVNATTVRVLGTDDAIVGVGVLVGPREILTCAHVVNAALGRNQRAQDQPSDDVSVVFSTGDGAPLRARVQRWRPPPRTGATGDDVAGLVLTGSEIPDAVTALTPARLAANPPAQGQVVSVFGYPGSPPRPDGAWVEATVRGRIGYEGRHLQLDSTPDSALRIQPGFSGSPVYDRVTGRVLGLLTTAPPAASADRDSYAVTAEQLRCAWPEILDPRHIRSRGPDPGGVSELTVLQVSDIQFGHDHLFGGNGLTPADQAHDTLFRRLHDDLDQLATHYGLRPDLMVVSGDLTAHGRPSEFDQAVEFLTVLTEAVELPRDRVAVVPGNHDANRDACLAYFQEQKADENEPVAPYWPKWKHFATAFGGFYDGVAGVSFTPDEPWTLFEIPDLAVVVAGLNSTMAESHREEDHYGWVGEHQLRWFAQRLSRYRDQGWLRIGAVHHNAVRGAVADDENLRDAADLDLFLGQSGLVNLLLHGHTSEGRLQRLSSGLLAISTGSAAVTPQDRPHEVPNQYQLITLHPGGVTRHARQYAVGQRRWIGDTRISHTGSDWHHHEPYPFTHVEATFTGHRARTPPPPPGSEFFERVVEAATVSHPDATVTPCPDRGYLRISQPLPGGVVKQWPVGVVNGEVAEEDLDTFVREVHRPFAAADAAARSELVYSGSPAAETMTVRARRHGVLLRSFLEYQGLVDLRPLVERQTTELATDPIYPPELYVPQRYTLLGDPPETPAHEDLLHQVTQWLGADGARLVMVLGDFGRGKTFLLRELARTLPERLPHLWPVLVELRSLEKAPSVEELLARHLFQQKVDGFDVEKLSYMIRSGRVALLFDGFDELELRVGYDNAADYLKVLLRAVTGNAKVVLTSRTQHFHSSDQLHAALGHAGGATSTSPVAVLEGFTDEQILSFLAKHYGQDRQRALTRFALLKDVPDLRGLSHNPRMLAFIGNLEDEQLRAIQARNGQISAAELYRELVHGWLHEEAKRQRRPGGLQLLTEGERMAACTTLALRLWATTAKTIPVGELTEEVSGTLNQLAERGYTPGQAAHTIGTGTLLVRTPEGEFAFVHQSVMEWLTANYTAETLREGTVPDTLLNRKMSPLMLDFLCDLAGHDLARDWAADMLADRYTSQIAKHNALAIAQRLGSGALPHLPGVDLRSQNLTNRDLSKANLQRADLRGMRLVRTNLAEADLRHANLTGVRLIGGDLTGAQVDDSQWQRATLLGVSGLETLAYTPELAEASIPERDRAEVMVSPTGVGSDVAFSPDGMLLAIARGPGVEIVDAASGEALRVFSGHTREVTGVAFSPDGALLATASRDATVRLSEVSTGAHHRTLTGHTDTTSAVVFSPDGGLLATAAWDCTVRLWDPVTGVHRATLQGHIDTISAVAFSPDGTLLATASHDSAVRLWDVATGQHRITVQGSASALAVGGTVLYVPPRAGTIRVWDVATGRHRTVLDCPAEAVTSVAFSPDGTLLATTSHDGTTRISDVTTGQRRTTLRDHTDAVTAVAFSPDGTLLVTTSLDGTTLVSDVATGGHQTTILDSPEAVTSVAFSPDGTLLATTLHDGTARISDVTTGGPHTTITSHVHPMTGVAFSPDGTLLATASHDGSTRISDVTTGGPRTTSPGNGEALATVAFSPDGTLLATACRDATTRLLDTTTGDHRTSLKGHTGPVTGVAFSPDGTLLATASWDRTTQFWNPHTGRHRSTLQSHTGPVTSVAFSPDGTLLASTSHDGTTRLTEVATGQQYPLVKAHTDWVLSAAFSPDGTLFATTSCDHTIRLWDTTACKRSFSLAKKLRHTLHGHTDAVTSVAFSPTAALLATAADDGTVRLWDPTTGQHHSTLEGHTAAVRAVTFSPDGALLATAADDGTTRLWTLSTGTLLATLLALEDGGYAALLPEGTYKLDGTPGRSLWWAIKLCRFTAGELDPYDPTIRRLAADAPICATKRPGQRRWR